MNESSDANRRKVLKTIGGGVVGGVALAGNAVGSPRNNFGYVEDSTLEDATVTLSGPLGRKKIFCDAGGSESRVKTEVWNASNGTVSGRLYLFPSGYDDDDTVAVGNVFTSCTRNDDIKGEVAISKE